MIKKLYKLIQIVIIFFGLTACGAVSFFSQKGVNLDWRSLIFVATDNANLNSPVRADVVLINDEVTLTMITSLTAAKWFSSRGDFEKTLPYSFSYQSIEIVPGQRLVLSPDKFRPGRVAGAIIFADYLSSGEHRMRLDPFKGDILLQFGERSFSVITQPNK